MSLFLFGLRSTCL